MAAMMQIPQGKINFYLAWLIGAGTFFIYRLSIWQPTISISPRNLTLQKTPSLIEFLFLMLSIIIPALHLAINTILLICTTGFISTLYFIKINFRSTSIWGLRSIPAFKNIFLAASWAFTTVYIPYLFTQTHSLLFLSLLSRFIFILAICIAVDVRDIQRDTKTGTKTLAVIIGFSKTKYIAIILTLIFLTLTVTARQIQLTSMSSNFEYNSLLFTGILLFAILLYLNPKHKTSTYTLLLDGCMFLQAILLVAC